MNENISYADRGAKIPRLKGKRMLIGENGIAGLPISAPMLVGNEGDKPNPPIRWRMNLGNSFVLEYWEARCGGWVEVPLWEDRGEDELSAPPKGAWAQWSDENHHECPSPPPPTTSKEPHP